MQYILPHIYWIEQTMFPTTITPILFLTWLCAYFGVGLGAGLGWAIGTNAVNRIWR